jgi:hypothetical protein
MPMKQKLQELQGQLVKGQQQMALLDQRRQELRDTMLRINGAILVLEELIAKNGQQTPDQVTSKSA